MVWENAPQGVWGWYAEVTDQYGGLSRTPVQYLTVETDIEAPVLTLPDENTIMVGEAFDPMEGVTAKDTQDGDLTRAVRVAGTVDTGKAGTYELTYTVADRAGNTTVKTRVITVQALSDADVNPQPGPGQTGGTQGGNGSNPDQETNSASTDPSGIQTGDSVQLGALWAAGILSAALAALGVRKRKKSAER